MSRLGRVSWGLVDQAVVSVGGAVVSVQGAASLSVADFGALATALAAYYLLIAVMRGLVSDVYILRFASTPDASAGQAGDAQSAALVLALLMSAGLAAAAPVVASGSAERVVVALAVAVPFLLLQDLRRAVLLAAGATRRSAASSAVVLTGQLLGGLYLHVAHHVTAPALLLVWAAAAGCGMAVVPLPGPALPSATALRRWLRSSRPYWPSMLTEALALTGVNQFPLLVLALVAGPGVVGALRAATLLLAPMLVLHQASGRLLVAEASRVDPAARLLFSVRCQAVFLLAWGAWLVAVSAAPAQLLTRLLGAVLPAAMAALPGMVVFAAANMLVLAPTAVLFVSGRLGVSVVTRLAMAPVLAVIPPLLALGGADVGQIALGFGGFGLCSVVLWNAVGWRSLRVRRSPVLAAVGSAGAGG